MEVHHHPDLHHKKKPWKEYILEYIMIFLAVTTGFFAESLRENITSKEHVAQLCTGLVQELKIDTASLGSCISLQEVLVKNDDSLLMLLQQPLALIDKQKLQRYAVKAYSLRPFNPSNGNISAIKNELHLKQFSNSKIATYISNYESGVATLKVVENMQVALTRNYIESFCNAHFTEKNMIASFGHNYKAIDGTMRNLTQNDIDTFGVNITFVAALHANALMHLDSTRTKAIRLINYANKYFDLKQE